MEKNTVEPGRPHDNMAHANFMVVTKVCTHTSRTYDIHCLSTATEGCTNGPECYIIRTLLVLFLILIKCGSSSVILQSNG